MATSYLNITGKARFIKHVYTTDDAFGASKYKAGLWLEGKELEKFYASGVQAGFQQLEKGGDPTKLKEDEYGPYVVLSRDEMKMINKALVYFTPPYIKAKDMSYLVQYVDKDNQVIRQYQDINKKNEIRRVGEPFLIGNGSLVELNVCVFDTKTKGKGHRLEGLRILDLIEYIPQSKEDTTSSVSEEDHQNINTGSNETNMVTPVVKKKVSPF